MNEIDLLFSKEFSDGKSFSFAWRIFLDEYNRQDEEGKLKLVSNKPTLLEQRDLAFLAATVHRLTRLDGIKIPDWVVEDSTFLKEPYFTVKGDKFRLLYLVESPPEFKMRNIFTVGNVLSRVSTIKEALKMKVNKTLTATGALVLSVTLLTGFAGPAVSPMAVAAGVGNNNIAVTETIKGTAVAQMDDSEVFAVASSPTSFKDLSKSHWAYNEIMSAVQKGYFKGYTDGTFKPNAAVSRSEFVALLSRVSTNQPTEAGATFSDVPATNWAVEGINLAAQMGFIKQSDFVNGFKPNQAMTRIEMVRWMSAGLSQANPEYAQAIKDMAETVLPVQEYYKGTLAKADYGTVGLMMGTGILNGYDTGAFGGGNTTSRAEVAAILSRLEEAQKKGPDDFFNLRQMREIGTKGTNLETMGYSYVNTVSGVANTFAEKIWKQTLPLDNNAGEVEFKHMIVINPNDPSSIYHRLFYGKGNNLEMKAGAGRYLVASLLTVKPNRDKFTDTTLLQASDFGTLLGSASYKVGDADKYGQPLFSLSDTEVVGKGKERIVYFLGSIQDINLYKGPAPAASFGKLVSVGR
ncbi:hypothetical protein J41TS12_04950 [Paenibacillus antibioticophila]|uniref:SLH domain-containing protein n=1 Tax=Paenibacillus antibioticophila TaxID=1274374 RepID=A0A920CG23_9BACL|nr:S-layer homology domain-containing protein [Paenibacillus antibioticophila]GIO35634.1 hypothetical protein J41TS12_04950 [Paenibacillus antibioticophila]